MVIIPELSSVLLFSPSDTLLGWVLLGVGIFVGFFLKFKTFEYTFLSHAITLYVISRDLKLPPDIVLISGIPISIIEWSNHKIIQFWFFVSVIVAYFLSDEVHTVENDLFAGIFAAHYLSFLPSTKTKIFGILLTLLRHMFPRKVYVLYGCLLFLKAGSRPKDMSSILHEILKQCFFFNMASESWFGFVHSAMIFLNIVYKEVLKY